MDHNVSCACRWRPIASAPKDGTVVLAYMHGLVGHHHPSIDAVRWDDELNAWVDLCDPDMEVWGSEWISYWMPCPEPPAFAKSGCPVVCADGNIVYEGGDWRVLEEGDRRDGYTALIYSDTGYGEIAASGITPEQAMVIAEALFTWGQQRERRLQWAG